MSQLGNQIQKALQVWALFDAMRMLDRVLRKEPFITRMLGCTHRSLHISGRCLQKQAGDVRALSVVHDGLVVSGGEDKRVILWVCADALRLMVSFDGAWCFISRM